jgi:hypothetical protein
VFSATQRFWLRERSGCQVMPGEPGHHVSVAACLADVMESRLDQLRKMGARCDVMILLSPTALSCRTISCVPLANQKVETLPGRLS